MDGGRANPASGREDAPADGPDGGTVLSRTPKSYPDQQADTQVRPYPRAARKPARGGLRRVFRLETPLMPRALRSRQQPARSSRTETEPYSRLRLAIYYIAVGLAVASMALIAGTLIAALLGLLGG